MRGKAASGYRKSAKIKAIEREFDMPFHDVLAGFAADGNNRNQTAAILEYDRASFYRKLQVLTKAGYTINWPDGYATRAKPEYPNTEAQQAARIANLKHIAPENRKPWGNDIKVSPALLDKAVTLRAEGRTWRSVAHKLGVDISTLTRGRNRYKTPDPLGNDLVRQSQKKFSRSNTPCQTQ